MINKVLKIGGTTVLVCWASVGMAGPVDEGTSYAGLQFARITYSEDGISEDFEPTAFVARIGTFASDRISIEARFGFGLSEDSHTINGLNLDFEVDRIFGVYALGHVPVGEDSSIYGVIGFTDAELTATASNGSASASVSGSESDLSFGIGADIGLFDAAALNIEYMQYFSKSDFDASALSAGVRFTF